MSPDDDEQVMAAEYRVRARFYAIRQVDGERAYDWYRRVLAAAVPCGFGVHRRACTVADKFVTGLRPGPVADRLLGERADGRLDDLLAAAVEAETAAGQAGRIGAVAGRGAITGCSRDVLAEIREGLKMYQYSSGDVRAKGGGDADASVDNHKKNDKTLRIVYNEKTPVDNNENSEFHEKSWWKNKIENNSNRLENNYYSPLTCKSCNLATKLLESFEEKISLLHLQPNYIETHTVNNNYDGSCSSSHDDSKCYCSRITNCEFKKRNVPLSKSKKPDIQIPRCLDYNKKTECCVCSISD